MRYVLFSCCLSRARVVVEVERLVAVVSGVLGGGVGVGLVEGD